MPSPARRNPSRSYLQFDENRLVISLSGSTLKKLWVLLLPGAFFMHTAWEGMPEQRNACEVVDNDKPMTNVTAVESVR
jgi:hypothetical protein